MGVEERQCECVANEYSIEYCETCNKYVCINDEYICIKVPKFNFSEDICGFCQQKKKLSAEARKEFTSKEKNIKREIKKLQNELFAHYKKLEKADKI